MFQDLENILKTVEGTAVKKKLDMEHSKISYLSEFYCKNMVAMRYKRFDNNDLRTGMVFRNYPDLYEISVILKSLFFASNLQACPIRMSIRKFTNVDFSIYKDIT